MKHSSLSLSYLLGYSDKKPKEVSFAAIVERIRNNPSLKEQTEKYRYLKARPLEQATSGVKAGFNPVRVKSSRT